MSSPNTYCHNCGIQLPPGSSFCPRCGTAVYAPGQQAQGSQPPSDYDRRAYKEARRQQRRQEKAEKNEKAEKGEKEEKSGTGGLVGPIIGGGILIWLGLTFYLQQIGYFVIGNWWAFFIIGVGFILILQGILLSARMHRGIIGPVIGGGILVIIGLAFFYGALFNLWPLILVVIGLAIIASAFTARRRTPNPT